MRINNPLDEVFKNGNSVRILRQLVLYPSKVTTGRGLAGELGMNHATCIRTLDSLVDIGAVSRKTVGRSSVYEIPKDSVLCRDLLMPLFEKEANLLSELVGKAKATRTEAHKFKAKALQYRKAMELSHDARLWDAAVSNAVHAVILMANAVSIRHSGEYFIGQDHNQAPGYLEEAVNTEEAAKAARQMQAIIRLKGLVEYEARSCTAKESGDVVKRVERFFSWAEKQIPGPRSSA